MEILILILLYGLIWGLYHFWGFNVTIGKVLSNPENYSSRTVRFYKKLNNVPKAILSFLVALSVPFIFVIVLWILKTINLQ